MSDVRVHLVHQGFGDYVGGLVSGLEAVGESEVALRVTTLASGTAALTSMRSAPELHQTISLPRFRDPRSVLAARRAVGRLLAEPADVVHWQAAGNPWVDLAFHRWLARRDRLPAVVTVHDMQPHPGDRTVLPGTFPLIRRMVRRADRVIVHAPHIRDQAIAAGASADRVSVLAHGELGSRYLPVGRLPLEPSTEPVVLFFGRAQGYKGLDVAVEAMAEVVERVPGARLVVAGSGSSLDEVFPTGKPVPAWCELHRGRVEADRVVELFGRAAVVALPYREASQSGVAALAAGFGRPVVASRVPGLADIVDHGRSGLLVDPGSVPALTSGLIEVLTDQTMAAELAAGASAAARGRLAWPHIAKQLIGIYHDAVRPGYGRPATGAEDSTR